MVSLDLTSSAPGRSTREALRRVEELSKEGNYWVVAADIKGYFDSIPHNKLMEKVGNKISDGRVLELIESYLKAEVMTVQEISTMTGCTRAATACQLP